MMALKRQISCSSVHGSERASVGGGTFLLGLVMPDDARVGARDVAVEATDEFGRARFLTAMAVSCQVCLGGEEIIR